MSHTSHKRHTSQYKTLQNMHHTGRKRCTPMEYTDIPQAFLASLHSSMA